MTVESLMQSCLVMMQSCVNIRDATAGAVNELLQRLIEKDNEIEEQRLDNEAMRAWGVRVEARRLASAKKDEAVKASLSSILEQERDKTESLLEKNQVLEAQLLNADKEIIRLREAALETCSVSRTIMLQNAHTRMEREIEQMRDAQARKSPIPVGVFLK